MAQREIKETMWPLLEIVQASHYPNAPASNEEIRKWEDWTGYCLPPDMRFFYEYMDGAALFDPSNSPYAFLPLNEICRARVALLGEDIDDCGCESWYVFCDVRDGNYVGIELNRDAGAPFSVIDCFHELVPKEENCKVICASFTEFLSGALNSGGHGLFWLGAE